MTGLSLSQAGSMPSAATSPQARRAIVLSRGLERLYRMAYNVSPIAGRSTATRLSAQAHAGRRGFYRQPRSLECRGHGGGPFRPAQALASARKAFEPLRKRRQPAAVPMDKPQTSERRAVDTAGSPIRYTDGGVARAGRTDSRWPALVCSPWCWGAAPVRGSTARWWCRPGCCSVDADLESHGTNPSSTSRPLCCRMPTPPRWKGVCWAGSVASQR